ncbi:MAG: FAD-binding protein [Deltaproteobacteria bacterium]|nr:FAD-binding protein [Deltaproteobacteria bacterium]
MKNHSQRVIILGASVAGICLANEMAMAGHQVLLFSQRTLGVAPQALGQSVFRASLSKKDQDQHFLDSVRFAGFLGNHIKIRELCQSSASYLQYLQALGLELKAANSSLGLNGFYEFNEQRAYQLLLQQLRCHQASHRVRVLEHWRPLALANTEQGVAGVVAENAASMEIEAFSAEAVVCAEGFAQSLFFSQSSFQNDGFLLSCLKEGASLQGAEFIAFHPLTASSQVGSSYLSLDVLNQKAGRLFLQKNNGERFYFLEDWYSDWQDLPDFLISRAMAKVQATAKTGESIFLEQGDQQIPVRPGFKHFLGGLATDDAHQTDLSGLYAIGFASNALFGAGCLPSNAFALQMQTGLDLANQLMQKTHWGGDSSLSAKQFLPALKDDQKRRVQDLLELSGPENLSALKRELSELCHFALGPMRDNAVLQKFATRCEALKEKASRLGLHDQSEHANQELARARDLFTALELAPALSMAAEKRDESRGVHYKIGFYEPRDDLFLQDSCITLKQGRYDYQLKNLQHAIVKPKRRQRLEVAG